MTLSRKILLGASAVFYALVLYGFLFEELWFILAFFILHSVCLMLFAFLSMSNPKLEAALEAAEEERDAVLASSAVEIENLGSQVSSLSATLSEEKEQSRNALAEASKERDAAIAQRDKAISQLEEGMAQNAIGNFLPTTRDKDTDTLVNIVAVARDTVSELIPYAERAKLAIHVSSTEEKYLVRADAEKLHIMFRNIIDNSIKYMKRAGTLVITISNIDEDLFIVLKDNGFGLPEEETEHIFELNYQGSNRISGNGLGLTQAKAIVEYYGGTIYAKSKPGGGMGIYVQLPTQ